MKESKLLFKSPLIDEKKEKIKELIADLKMFVKCFIVALMVVLSFFGAMNILQTISRLD